MGRRAFPFLFGGTFIEAGGVALSGKLCGEDFPSFSEGLSLRPNIFMSGGALKGYFPSFSEGLSLRRKNESFSGYWATFPFLFGGTFIEAVTTQITDGLQAGISLPFRRDFH